MLKKAFNVRQQDPQPKIVCSAWSCQVVISKAVADQIKGGFNNPRASEN
jgi:hypothetical protein